MRVYELAKKLGMESRHLISELVRLGIEVTSHSNTLDEGTAQRVVKALQGGEALDPPHDSTVKGGGRGTHSATSEGKKTVQSSTSKRDTQKGTRTSSKVTGVIQEEPKKPEKKHILIKRKREDEEPLEPLLTDESENIGTVQLETPSVQSHPLSAESSSALSTSSLSTPVETPTHPSGDDEGVESVSPDPAVHEESVAVMKESIPPVVEESPGIIKADKKDASQISSGDPIEEKIKKSKKVGRPRNEDLFAARYEDAARWQDLRPLPTLRREERTRHFQPTSVTEITKPRKRVIKLQPGITVKEFAELLGQRPVEIIRKLMEVGIGLTLNQPMNLDAGVLIAEGFEVHVEVVSQKEGEELLEDVLDAGEHKNLIHRAPVVTIMGHVDHGKTSLLDAIRQTQITDQEAGGITQHIGAYSVSVGEKQVTFLDTPGHEAFTAMRARGAKVTDIVVLVVSADDGAMPQTVEAIHHAQAADVPIIVAINKIDKPGANPERVKQGLVEHGLIPEPWGGQTIFVEVSAKQKVGLENLLEMILLQAEVMELKADIARPAKGIALEAKLDRGRGAVATVLVQDGILKVGDVFVVGSISGRVRAMNSDSGSKLKEAGPSTPIEVIGLLGVPAAGDQFVTVKDERIARDIAQSRHQKQRTAELASGGGGRRTLDDLYAEVQEGEIKELSVLIKADVQGSVGALSESIEKLSSDLVRLRIIHAGVGGISESDVLLAAAAQALIIGFHVRPEPKAAGLAEREGVEIRLYTVIYNAIADIKSAAEGLLAPTIKERVLGRAEVRQLFTVPKSGTVAGCYVTDGMISRSSAGVRILRDNVTVYEGKVGSLRRFKDDVREVQQGYECGIGVENYNDIKMGDIIEAFVHDQEAVRL